MVVPKKRQHSAAAESMSASRASATRSAEKGSARASMHARRRYTSISVPGTGLRYNKSGGKGATGCLPALVAVVGWTPAWLARDLVVRPPVVQKARRQNETRASRWFSIWWRITKADTP